MPKCFNVCVERHKRGPIVCEDCMELAESDSESEVNSDGRTIDEGTGGSKICGEPESDL